MLKSILNECHNDERSRQDQENTGDKDKLSKTGDMRDLWGKNGKRLFLQY